MIKERIKDIAAKVKQYNSYFHSVEFVEPLGKYYINDQKQYNGLSDKNGNFAYLRLNGIIEYSPIDEETFCSNSNYWITIPIKIVASVFDTNKFTLEKRLRDTLLGLTFASNLWASIELLNSELDRENIFNSEIEDTKNIKVRDNITWVTIDFSFRYKIFLNECLENVCSLPKNC